jgi:hypothetical protein
MSDAEISLGISTLESRQGRRGNLFVRHTNNTVNKSLPNGADFGPYDS